MMQGDTTNAVTKQTKLAINDLIVYTAPLLLGLLCYINGVDAQFVHDDVLAIQENPDVTGKTSLLEIFYNDFWGKAMSDRSSHKSYRPLCVLTFRLNYSMSDGDPALFHVINLLLHLVVVALLTHVCRNVFFMSRRCAGLAAALFAVHPVHTEAVTGVVGRADVLACIFFLFSFYLYARCMNPTDACQVDINDNIHRPSFPMSATQLIMFLGSMALAVAAMLTKETGISVLGGSLLYDVICNGTHVVICLRSRSLSQEVKGCLVRCCLTLFTGMALLYLRLTMMDFQQPEFQDVDNPASFSSSFFTRCLTFNYLTWFNFWLLLNPSHLSYDWTGGSIPLVESLGDVRNVWTLTFYTSAAVLIWRCLVAKTWPEKASSKRLPVIPLMSVAFMLLPFLPASNLFFTVGFVIAERILYIPSVGFCMLVASGHQILSHKFPKLRTALGVFYLALLVVMATRTWHRNKVWETRETLFRSGVQELPQNAKVHYNMANLMKDKGDLGRAEHHYRMAIRLYPGHPSYHLNLGNILTNLTEARLCYLEALRLAPHHKGALVNLGSLMIDEGNETGLSFIQRALELDANYFEGLLIMGKAKLATDDHTLAGHYIHKALSLRPHDLNVRLHHGVYLHKTGQLEQALQEYQYVLSKRKYDLIAMKNAAKIQVSLENLPEALSLLKVITQIETNCVESLSLLGYVYKKMGQRHDAVISLAKASHLAPNNTNVQLKYIKALKDNNQSGLARTYLHQLAQKTPHDLNLLWFAFNFSMEDNRIEDASQFVAEAIIVAKKTKHQSLKHLYKGQAELYQRAKDSHRALQYYLKAIGQDNSFVDALVNAGSIYFIKKNYGQAEDYYLRALKVDPDNYLAVENLKILRNEIKKLPHKITTA